MFDRFSRPTLYNVLTCRTPPADNLFIDFEAHTAHYKSANPKSNRSNSSRSSYVGPLTGKNGSHHKVVIIGTKTNCCDAIKIRRQKKKSFTGSITPAENGENQNETSPKFVCSHPPVCICSTEFRKSSYLRICVRSNNANFELELGSDNDIFIRII
jgi:hypothetical protein